MDCADGEDLDDEALLEAAVVAGRALDVDRGEGLVRHAALSHGVGLPCNGWKDGRGRIQINSESGKKSLKCFSGAIR